MSPREPEPGSQQCTVGQPGLRGSGQSRQWGQGLSTYLRQRTLGGLARLRDTPKRGQSARAPPPPPPQARPSPHLPSKAPTLELPRVHACTHSQPFGHSRRSTPTRSDKTHSQETQGSGKVSFASPTPILFDASSTVPWCPRGPGGPEGRRRTVVRCGPARCQASRGPEGKARGSRAAADTGHTVPHPSPPSWPAQRRGLLLELLASAPRPSSRLPSPMGYGRRTHKRPSSSSLVQTLPAP